MSRKVVLIIAAVVLLVALPVAGGIAAVAYFGVGKTAIWAYRQYMLQIVKGGPEAVLEVDKDAVRRSSYDLLRRSIVLHLREAKLSFSTRATDAGIDVTTQEADRETVLGVLRGKLAPAMDIRLADDGMVHVSFPDAMLAKWTADATEQSRGLLSARFLALRTKAVVTVQPRPAGPRLLMQMARSEDSQRLIAFATKPGELTFRMIDVGMTPEKALSSGVPQGDDILYSPVDQGKQPYLVEKRVVMSGRDLTEANPSFDQRTNEAIVAFRFNEAGARKFAQATSENVGRPFAIVVDGEVLSAPIIREPITGGYGQISGNFTVQSANELATVLRYGALPAKLKVVEERAAKAQ